MGSESWTVPPEAAGARLDKWLADASRLASRAKALDALRKGRVFLDEVEQTVADAGRRLAAGQAVRLWMDRPGSASRRGARKMRGIEILFEDGALLVADKPAGLPTVPVPDRPEDPSLVSLVAEHWRSHGGVEPRVVHRIDGDTSGVVVFARTPAAYESLKAQFAARTPLRRYLAFVHGSPKHAEGSWRNLLLWDPARRLQLRAPSDASPAREAVTHYRVLERYENASLLELRLETGRQHQIRVQAMLQGHPILGESIYVGDAARRPGPAHARQALHAAALRIEHPLSHQPLEVEAPLPRDLASLRRRLAAAAKPKPPTDVASDAPGQPTRR